MRISVLCFAVLLAGCGASDKVDESGRAARHAALDAAAKAVVPGARWLRSPPYSWLTFEGSLSGPYVSDCELRLAIMDVSAALGDGSLESEAGLLVEQARLHEAALAAGGYTRIASHGTGIGAFARFGEKIYPAQDVHGARIQAGRTADAASVPGARYMLQANAPRWITWSAYVSPRAGATVFVRMELDRRERLLMIEMSCSDRSVLDRPHPFTAGPPWREAVASAE